jgi:alanyl-tRNA synthetase
MRRIEAVTGDGADAYVAERFAALERVAAAVGATSVEGAPDRVAALRDELREAKRRLRAGGGGDLAKAADLVARAEEVAPGIRLVRLAGPFESIDAMKGYSKEVRAALGSGVIALGLDAEVPQVWVTVSDDLVASGVSAGGLVRSIVGHIDGKGGGRAEMAQGMGTRREGLGEALEAVAAELRARDGAGG